MIYPFRVFWKDNVRHFKYKKDAIKFYNSLEQADIIEVVDKNNRTNRLI